MREIIKNVFEQEYKGKRLLDFFVNDMRITYWYDDGDKNSEIKQQNYWFWSERGEGEKARASDEHILNIKNKLGLSPYSFWHDCLHITYYTKETR